MWVGMFRGVWQWSQVCFWVVLCFGLGFCLAFVVFVSAWEVFLAFLWFLVRVGCIAWLRVWVGFVFYEGVCESGYFCLSWLFSCVSVVFFCMFGIVVVATVGWLWRLWWLVWFMGCFLWVGL
jgi:hypothetical protein